MRTAPPTPISFCALFMRKFEPFFKILHCLSSPLRGSQGERGASTRRAFRYFLRALSRLRASKEQFAKTELLTKDIVAEKTRKMKYFLDSGTTHPPD